MITYIEYLEQLNHLNCACTQAIYELLIRRIKGNEDDTNLQLY